MLWIGVYLAFPIPVAKILQTHAADLVLRFRMPSKRISLLQASRHLTITAKILLLFPMLGNVPRALRVFRPNSTSPTVSFITPVIYFYVLTNPNSSQHPQSRMHSSTVAYDSLPRQCFANLYPPASFKLPQQHRHFYTSPFLRALLQR